MQGASVMYLVLLVIGISIVVMVCLIPVLRKTGTNVRPSSTMNPITPASVTQVIPENSFYVFEEVVSLQGWGSNASYDSMNNFGLAFDAEGLVGTFFNAQMVDIFMEESLTLKYPVLNSIFSKNSLSDALYCFIANGTVEVDGNNGDIFSYGNIDIWIRLKSTWTYSSTIETNIHSFGSSIGMYENNGHIYLIVSSFESIIQVYSKRVGEVFSEFELVHTITSGQYSKALAVCPGTGVLIYPHSETAHTFLNTVQFPWDGKVSSLLIDSVEIEYDEVIISNSGEFCAIASTINNRASNVRLYKYNMPNWLLIEYLPDYLPKSHNGHGLCATDNWSHLAHTIITGVNNVTYVYKIGENGRVVIGNPSEGDGDPQEIRNVNGHVFSIGEQLLLSGEDNITIYNLEIIN
jgi:hypothetical protein